ncbi:hypothetical protein Tco_0670603 [Tanacetum coccineum]
MSAMANSTPVITTIRNTDGREKTPREADTAPQASIQKFCEKHYDDILPIIMEKARQDKRKGLQSRLDFGDTPKRARRIRNESLSSSDRNSPVRSRSRIRSHIRGVKESYGDTYSSQRTRHRDRSCNNDYHGGMKKKRVNESPSSHASVSSFSHGTHQRPRKRRESMDEEDLAVPWTCEDVDPFTSRIRKFRSSRKTRMPNNVKTYDGTGDPEDHLKVFQAAAQVEHWAMPTWCHMFNSTLIGAARVWFDELPTVKRLMDTSNSRAFLSTSWQQKKYVTDRRMKGAPECMRISGFMHGVNNPKLTKRLNERVPKTIEDMMTTTAAFIQGETAAASKKKVHAPWKSQDQSKRHASDRKLEFRKPDFRNQPREGRGSNKFTPLTRTPKEIFKAEAAKFKPPTPMVTPLEKRSYSSKFCEFHNDKGHSTDECVQLKKQIEELVRAGKLSQFIKGIRQEKDQQRPGKKDILAKDKATAIYMIQSWQRVTRQKVTQSFDRIREIVFPPLTANEGVEGPLVIEAEIGGHTVHRMADKTLGDYRRCGSKKKVHAPWKSQDQSKRHASDRKLEFRKPDIQNQPREGRGSNKFTLLTRTPKEIFMAEAAKFKPPTPMVTPLEKRSDSSKFCEFHNDKGHSTDECMQLKKQIEELVRAGKLSQFLKGIRQEKDQQRPGKKECHDR